MGLLPVGVGRANGGNLGIERRFLFGQSRAGRLARSALLAPALPCLLTLALTLTLALPFALASAWALDPGLDRSLARPLWPLASRLAASRLLASQRRLHRATFRCAGLHQQRWALTRLSRG